VEFIANHMFHGSKIYFISANSCFLEVFTNEKISKLSVKRPCRIIHYEMQNLIPK